MFKPKSRDWKPSFFSRNLRYVIAMKKASQMNGLVRVGAPPSPKGSCKWHERWTLVSVQGPRKGAYKLNLGILPCLLVILYHSAQRGLQSKYFAWWSWVHGGHFAGNTIIDLIVKNCQLYQMFTNPMFSSQDLPIKHKVWVPHINMPLGRFLACSTT